MFAPSLYPAVSVVGDFGSAAERNYVMDDRDFRTLYKQTLFSFYTTGNLIQFGPDWIVAGLGFEYRLDDLESIPDQSPATDSSSDTSRTAAPSATSTRGSFSAKSRFP